MLKKQNPSYFFFKEKLKRLIENPIVVSQVPRSDPIFDKNHKLLSSYSLAGSFVVYEPVRLSSKGVMYVIQ